MPDYKFAHIPSLENWIIQAPHRSKRPDTHERKKKECPFDPGKEKDNPETYRIGGEKDDKNWSVRVIKNKYPFAPMHEVIIHTPKHTQSISELNVSEVKLVIEAFANRYNKHVRAGTVCIFSNSGHAAGESINHSHSQLVVIPKEIPIIVPSLEEFLDYRGEHLLVRDFSVICPPYSQYADETWIVPVDRGKLFGEIAYPEMESLAYILRRLIYIFEARHDDDFPYNFYIYPYRDWYLRIMPRAKIPGGFEMATGIFVNTQDPRDTMEFIKEHFAESEREKIKKRKAEYRRGV